MEIPGTSSSGTGSLGPEGTLPDEHPGTDPLTPVSPGGVPEPQHPDASPAGVPSPEHTDPVPDVAPTPGIEPGPAAPTP